MKKAPFITDCILGIVVPTLLWGAQRNLGESQVIAQQAPPPPRIYWVCDGVIDVTRSEVKASSIRVVTKVFSTPNNKQYAHRVSAFSVSFTEWLNDSYKSRSGGGKTKVAPEAGCMLFAREADALIKFGSFENPLSRPLQNAKVEYVEWSPEAAK